MPETPAVPDPRRRIPRTDAALAEPRLAAASAQHGRERVRREVRQAQDLARAGTIPPEAVVDRAAAALEHTRLSTTAVLNATGVVLHTNLGRAPLSDSAVRAMVSSAAYLDVEFDLATGARARRGAGVLSALLAAVPAAGGALVVNNGAAALVLTTTVLAATGEVLVSRGEMVEIGDGFRLPDLIASTGTRLREVGTTNRTRLADYADAVGPDTRAILKVHPSNFTVTGFTAEATVAELATLGLPVVHDIGSGLLHPHPLLPDEPDATTSLTHGASVVTCSGDKLLGGPQAGLVLGRADLVERLRRHPLARALRPDKTALAALEATLDGGQTPTWRSLLAGANRQRTRCDAVAAVLPAGSCEVVPSRGRVGGGGAPGVGLPGWAVAVDEAYAAPLRLGSPPVVARVESGRCLVDLRCVPEEADHAVVQAIRAVLAH